MQAYSIFGDGDIFTYMAAVVFALGYQLDYLYLMMSYVMTFHWSNMLKLGLHHSRP